MRWQSVEILTTPLRHIFCLSMFVWAMLVLPVAAQDCSIEAAAPRCCDLAEPLDGRTVAEGGYGWHPGPGGVPGLCQGLASRNTSGGLISLVDLRETPTFSELPDVVTVAHRTLPVSPASPVEFNGSPLRPGAAFFLAGSFESAAELIWVTAPFSRRAQNIQAFGFEAVFRHAGRIVHTPLVFNGIGSAGGGRSEVRAILRSTLPIGAAIVTMQPVSPDDLMPAEAAPRVLDIVRPSAEHIEVMLSTDFPEAFQLSVIACHAGDQDCRADEDSSPQRVFRIFWPDP